MSHYDVEALLDAAANADGPKEKKPAQNGSDEHVNGDRGDKHDNKTPRDSSRDRKRRDRRSVSPPKRD